MKKMIVLYTIFISMSVNAQSLFNQKKTKLKYIAQQIALFELYAGYLKKGYDIAHEGWSMIDDIKHGDFNLHNDYFNSLKEVKPAISGNDQVKDITKFQEQILKTTDDIKNFVTDNENIQDEERQYISRVNAGLLDKSTENLDELIILTTDGMIEMKDDERLQRIEDLYIDMQDKYSFIKSFDNSIRVLALSRAKHSNDINTSQLLYDIK